MQYAHSSDLPFGVNLCGTKLNFMFLTSYLIDSDTMISPGLHSAQILEVVFTVSPINENYGLGLPITPAITDPLLMPIFKLNNPLVHFLF